MDNDLYPPFDVDPEYQKLLDEVHGASERAGAIVASAYAEDALLEAIKSKFRPLSKNDETNLITGPTAPLHTFGGKIALGFALSLYNESIRNELKIMKDVRNAFAHNLTIRGFDHPSIVKLCRRLRIPERSAANSGEPVEQDARQRFLMAANLLVVGLQFRAHGSRLADAFLNPDEIAP